MGTALPAPSSAQTQTTDLAIQELTSKLTELTREIKKLEAQRQELMGELVLTLKEGSNGDEVKKIQALLAADPEIYPEGLITGYYGALTAKAVRKFQKKHGLEQVGQVGAKTLKKLNEAMKENPVALQDSDSGQGKRPCAIVPPGHLIAPGWLRKQGNNPIVPPCQTLPPGILKKLRTSTSTADTVPPVISQVSASGVTTSSAAVSWITNESSTSKVYYGLTVLLNLQNASSVADAALVANHTLTLAGLNATTTYYFAVESKDAAGNTATSSQQSFATL